MRLLHLLRTVLLFPLARIVFLLRPSSARGGSRGGGEAAAPLSAWLKIFLTMPVNLLGARGGSQVCQLQWTFQKVL